MYRLLPFLLLGACTSTNPWRLDAISAGDRAFDSKKIVYVNAERKTPLVFEFVRMANTIDTFISLTQFRWHPDKTQSITALFIIDGEKREEKIPVHEGRMKLRLSQELTADLILALQQGKKVDILIDGYEETLDPKQFVPVYSKFVSQSIFGGFE